MDGRADAVVLFGITGDLAAKKLIPALYELTRRGRLDLPVIGVARSEWDHEELVAAARKAVTEAVDVVDEAAFDALSARLTMISGGTGIRAPISGWPTRWAAPHGRCSTWRSRPPCSAPWSVAWPAPGWRRAAG